VGSGWEPAWIASVENPGVRSVIMPILVLL